MVNLEPMFGEVFKDTFNIKYKYCSSVLNAVRVYFDPVLYYLCFIIV